jgi:hypothetical protein
MIWNVYPISGFFPIPAMGSRIKKAPDPGSATLDTQNTVFPVQDLGVDTQVAQHLAATYGDRAFSVGKGWSHLCSYLSNIFSSLLGIFGLQRIFGGSPVLITMHTRRHFSFYF